MSDTLTAPTRATVDTSPGRARRPTRTRPGIRHGYTLDVCVGGIEMTMTANTYDDGRLREIFLHAGKHGSTLAGLLDTIATTLSVGLRGGVPLQNYVDHLADLRFIPDGMTDDPNIPDAASITDYLIRRLARDFLRADPVGA